MAQGTTKGVPIDVDPTLAADSDLLVPSQKAIKTYVDTNFLNPSDLSATTPLTYSSSTGVFTINQASGSSNGYLSSTDWSTFNSKQDTITLTTTGSSGFATLVGSTLNIPNYLAGSTATVVKNTSTYTSVGTGSQTLASVLIPAGTFVAGDVILVRARFRRNATGASTQSHIHVNTANNLTGATVWKSAIFATGSRWNQFYGHGVVKNAATDTELFATNTNVVIDDGTNTFDGRNVAIDWSVNQYFLFSLFGITAPDVFLLSFFEILKR
jgi:hypothetical protein